DREKVTVDILTEGKKGILGFGAQKARIRASLRRSVIGSDSGVGNGVVQSAASQLDGWSLGEKAKGVLADILRLMEVEASIDGKTTANGEIILEIRAEDSGLLIGRKGQTLEALQYLVTRIAGERQASEGPHILVDIENYRERRHKSLEDMALRLGEKAKRQRKTVTIDPLSAADRRIIHAALQDDPWLTTKSLGQGSYRRLVIIPERDRKTKKERKESPIEKQRAKVNPQ
ncbi:MAG: RNA-binding cell elongation regulator Jag/EloR, partial [Candidatus Binatia bacterium]